MSTTNEGGEKWWDEEKEGDNGKQRDQKLKSEVAPVECRAR